MPKILIQPDPEIEYIWRCSECSNTAPWSMQDVQDAGTPVCTDCDVDMELADSCQGCNKVFDDDDIDGGRCRGCGKMISTKPTSSRE